MSHEVGVNPQEGQSNNRPWIPPCDSWEDFVLPTQSSSSDSSTDSVIDLCSETESEEVSVSTETDHISVDNSTTTTSTTSLYKPSPYKPSPDPILRLCDDDIDIIDVSIMPTKTRGQENAENQPRRSSRVPKVAAKAKGLFRKKKPKDQPKAPPAAAKRSETTTKPPPAAAGPFKDILDGKTHADLPLQVNEEDNGKPAAIPQINVLIQNVYDGDVLTDQSTPTQQRKWMDNWTATVIADPATMADIDLSRIKGVTSQDDAYNRRKARMFQRYLASFKNHPVLGCLTQECRGIEGESSLVIFRVLEGPRTPSKCRLLNNTLLIFSVNLKKKPISKEEADELTPEASSPVPNPILRPTKDEKINIEHAERMYEPNTILSFFKLIFAVFRSMGVYITQSDLRMITGSYHLYWDLTFAHTASIRSDYATASRRAQVEENATLKIRIAIQSGDLDLENNYHHVLMYLTWSIAECFARRGSKEVSLSSEEDESCYD